MSKQINLVPCAYCGAPAHPTEGLDHGVARAFFRPTGLNPKKPILVPACRDCNEIKCKLETYVPLITNIAIDQIDDRVRKWFNYIHYDQKRLFTNAEFIFAQQESGILLPKIKMKYDWSSAAELYKYIAMSIVYEYCGKTPVKPRFPNSIVACMPRTDNNFIFQTISSNCFFDNYRYNGKVPFAVTSNGNTALVYFQILDANFIKNIDNKYQICDIIAVVLSKHDIKDLIK